MNNSKQSDLVEKGYDKIAQTYHDQRDRFKSDDILQSYVVLLPSGGDVLDVGCGAGVPVARVLVDAGFNVTGIDISTSMLELARMHVPEATFYKMDMRELSPDLGQFDGISAFYSLFHTPKEKHANIIAGFYQRLRKNGILMFCTGTQAWEGVEKFHGSAMYWSHPDSEATRQHVVDAGFELLMAEIREYGGEKQYWIIARKAECP
jgi:2-polyprenyl-3-methyl-5-hydroxy-6-metoxy-1,4-benzoquinol methylase